MFSPRLHSAVPPLLYLLATLLNALAPCAAGADETDYPARPIKIIVPFAAGGGTDAFARLMVKAIEDNDLLPQPLVVINVGGASGTIGSRRVKQARPDGYTVLVLHDAMLMSKYAGKVSYGAESFTPVAGTVESGIVIATGPNSEFENLAQVVEAARARPGEITFGCNLGTPTHFAGLLLEKEAGIEFRYVQTGDGAHRFGALMGSQIALSVFSMDEFVRYRGEGIRAVACLGKQRHPAAPDLPTALEQGYDALTSVTKFWWMPKGTPPERAEIFADALESALQTSEVQKFLEKTHEDPVYLDGDELQARLDELDAQISGVDLRKPIPLPDLPALLVLAACALGGVIVVRGLRNRPPPEPASPLKQLSRKPGFIAVLPAAIGLTTLIYVIALDFGILSFIPATFIYVCLLGGMLASSVKGKRVWLTVLAMAIVLSFGLAYLFTRVFVTDLP